MNSAEKYRAKAGELLATAGKSGSSMWSDCVRLAQGYLRLAEHAEQAGRANLSVPQQQQQPQPK